VNWTSWIITPLLGAVIGYFTNWLAIKMLFRPHTKKFLFGIPLPFTPGLIPKERLKLSRAMGQTLGDSVLTPEVLVESISSAEVTEKLAGACQQVLRQLSSSVETLDAAAEKLLGDKKERIFSDAEAFALRSLASLLDSEAVQAGCRRLVREKLEIALHDPAVLLPVYTALKEFALHQGLTYLQSNDFAALLRRFAQKTVDHLSAEDQTFGDYVPVIQRMALKRLLFDKTPDIVAFLTSLPEKYPALDSFLRETVAQLAEQNFGRLIGIFVHYDTIYDNIKKKLFAYIEEPDNQVALAAQISAWFDGLMEKDTHTVMERLPSDSWESLVSKLASHMQASIDEPLLRSGLHAAETKAAAASFDAYEWLLAHVPGFDVAAADLVYGSLRTECLRLAPIGLQMLRGKAQEITVAQVAAKLTGGDMEKWDKHLLRFVSFVIEKCGVYVASALDVRKMVEDKINGFSVQEAEKLVFSVVNRELAAITNLGALLGLIIGFVPLLLNLAGL